MPDADELVARALSAGRRGDEAAVRQLLAAHPELARAADPQTGMTLLQQAARHGQGRLVEELLRLGANVNARNRWGLTALHYAARFGHAHVAATLLAHGADVDARAAGGQTPLDWAVVFQRPEVIRLLLDAGAEVGVFAAAGLGLCDRLAALLDAQPELVDARNDWGGTPLMVAALADRFGAAALLLARGADPTLRDQRGWTALDHARSEAMRRLLREAMERHSR